MLIPYTVAIVKSSNNYKIVIINPNSSETIQVTINEKQWEIDDLSTKLKVGINDIFDRSIIDELIQKYSFKKRV